MTGKAAKTKSKATTTNYQMKTEQTYRLQLNQICQCVLEGGTQRSKEGWKKV